MSYENVKKYFEDVELGERVKVLEQSSATVQFAAEGVGCEVKHCLSSWVICRF